MRLRIRVGVVFGGPSREHGVSFLSARCLLQNLPSERCEALPVFVGKDGLWHDVAGSRAEMLRYFARPPREALLDGVVPGSKPAPAASTVESFAAAFRDGAWDVVFPIVHGTFGEDGVLQGLFEARNVPYVDFGVAASAVGMDTVPMKAAFAAAGLPQVRYVGVPVAAWRNPLLRSALLPRIEALGLPLFVEPACAGSSVGITKVKRLEDLAAAVETALAVDATALVESAVDDRSCSVIPAEVPEAVREEVRRMACAAFDAVGGAGFARVDFFLERSTGRVFLNETNSLPGFTPISIFPKMWEAAGLPLDAFLDRLVRSAFRRPLRGR